MQITVHLHSIYKVTISKRKVTYLTATGICYHLATGIRYHLATGIRYHLVRKQTLNLLSQIIMVLWYMHILRMAMTKWAMLLLKSDAILT